MNPILVYTTASDFEEAQKLSTTLIHAKLCACTNIIQNMNSFFIWNSEITSQNEAILLIKTFDIYYEEIEKLITQNHSYQTPAIFSIAISNINNSYVKWMKESVLTK